MLVFAEDNPRQDAAQPPIITQRYQHKSKPTLWSLAEVCEFSCHGDIDDESLTSPKSARVPSTFAVMIDNRDGVASFLMIALESLRDQR